MSGAEPPIPAHDRHRTHHRPACVQRRRTEADEPLHTGAHGHFHERNHCLQRLGHAARGDEIDACNILQSRLPDRVITPIKRISRAATGACVALRWNRPRAASCFEIRRPVVPIPPVIRMRSGMGKSFSFRVWHRIAGCGKRDTGVPVVSVVNDLTVACFDHGNPFLTIGRASAAFAAATKFKDDLVGIGHFTDAKVSDQRAQHRDTQHLADRTPRAGRPDRRSGHRTRRTVRGCRP